MDLETILQKMRDAETNTLHELALDDGPPLRNVAAPGPLLTLACYQKNLRMLLKTEEYTDERIQQKNGNF